MVKYTKEERLEIGRRIYNRELSVYDAAAEYNINWYTARDYMREYRDLNNLDPMKRGPIGTSAITNQKKKYSDLETLTKEELIDEVIKKRLCSPRRWSGKGIHMFNEFEFEIIYKLSEEYPVQKLCSIMSVNRSSFYKWRNNMNSPNSKILKRNSDIELFKQYHDKYPTHGYRWLNAKIRLDLGVEYSDNYAQRCCSYAGIRSISRKCRYTKPGQKYKIYPNLLMADLAVNAPFEVVVSDMTAFWCNKTYYELTLYMDLFNNEIVAYDISSKKGDRETYINGLNELIEKKKEYKDLKMILHTDQGSVYSSKAYNELLPLYNITHSMSRAGTPTDNSAMEAINGWLKEELFNDFKIKDSDEPIKCVEDYIRYFNEERPSYSLNYLTPKQFKDTFTLK